MNLTYLVIPAAIFIVFGALSASLRRQISKARVQPQEERIYKVSPWFWSLLVLMAVGITLFLVNTYINERQLFWDDLIILLLVSLPILIPSLYCSFKSFIEVENGKVTYHNGFKSVVFSLSGVLSCKLTSFFMVEVTHAKNPKKPILIAACYKDISHFVATCQRAENRKEKT